MRQYFLTLAALILISSGAHAQDAKFANDGLKFSRDFYAKSHLVAIAELPVAFKLDRYPSNGPERIQCADGSYFRQHGGAWRHSDDPMRVGIPMNYPEMNRYVMTFAVRLDWGRYGDSVDEMTSRKVNGWIKLVDAALNIAPTSLKLVEKPELTRVRWVFETPSQDPNGAPTRLTFRKLAGDKNDNVLLREFSGSMRVEGDKVVPAGAADLVRMGFGLMIRADDEHEVSEYAWREMH